MNSINKNVDNVTVKVNFLDGHLDFFTVNMNSLGSELFQKVVIKNKLIESYFFGLSFESIDSDLCWLDLRKPIKKQVNIRDEYIYDFCVKFYTPDPNMLQDSLTKQLFVLQLKKDFSNGELICCDSTRILLGAFFFQLLYPNSGNQEKSSMQCFLKELFNDKNLSPNLVDQSLDFLKTLKDQTPEQTRYDLLETVRKIEFYGMKMHPAKDIEGMSLNLAVYHLGIVIFQKCTRINTFNWSKIRKLSFKRKRFLIKLHSEEYLELFILWVVQGFYKDTLEFYFDTRNSCKNFWKKCIEHHSFFRRQSSRSRLQTSTFKFHRNLSGSRFRYVGLTQAELEEFQHQSCGTNNCVHRSESTGRIVSRDVSFYRLHLPILSLRSDSVNCLSSLMDPASADSFEFKITEENVEHALNSPDDNICPWTQRKTANFNEMFDFGIPKNLEYLSNRLIETANENIKESKFRYCIEEGLKNQKYSSKVLATQNPSPTSLIINQKMTVEEKNNKIFNISSSNCFGSYEFIPKLLAQALSSDECSYELPLSNIEQTAHCDESINGGSNSRSLVSTSIISDTPSCLSLLNSMVKDFLFKEFTHIQELYMMKEIINTEVPKVSKIFSLLEILIKATETFIFQLEMRIQVNTQFQNNFPTSANHFFIMIDEFFNKTLEVYKAYVKCVEDILTGVTDQIPPPSCLRPSQLIFLSKSLFHARNPLRLLLSVIFHQRSRYICLVTINDFMLTKEEDQHLCKNVMSKIKPTIISIENLEEESQKLILATSIQGLNKTSLKRFGWLQKLTSKGASNRLFAITETELICLKKLQSNAFIVEDNWKLSDIQVGTVSDVTNYSNGFVPGTSHLELITITLRLANSSPKIRSNIVLLADCKKSQSLWIREIQSAKDTNIEDVKVPNIDKYSLARDWIQDYQLVEMCWHEKVSLSWNRTKFLFQLVLSSYVLKKVKVSSAWQRLWIVLSDYHLYFYKNHNDREAITSLSLIGYQIEEPNSGDSIHKDWVLKLSKESKVYFLKTENQYFYLRWRTALQCCTSFSE